MGWDVSSIRKNLEFTEKTKGEIKQIFHPYYVINLVLSFSFLFLKLTHPFCDYLFAPGPVRTVWTRLCLNWFSGNVWAWHARDRDPVLPACCHHDQIAQVGKHFPCSILEVRISCWKFIFHLLIFFSNGFVYAKGANIILFFLADPRLCMVYLILAMLQV